MKAGDLVKDFLTERIGIIMTVGKDVGSPGSLCVLGSTKGLSLFEPGYKEWCAVSSVDLL